MLQGDDGLIRKQHGLIYALALLTIMLLLAFSIVQFGNGKDHKQDNRVCTYSYRVILGFSWVRINWPQLPPDCHYVR